MSETILLTNSSIGQFKNCRKAWYQRNIECLVPRVQGKARGIGTAVHKGIETGSVEEAIRTFAEVFPNSQEEADELETNKVIVQAMLEGYFERFGVGFPGGTSRTELKFEVDIINPTTNGKSKTFKLAGKVDALIMQDGRYWLVEYKTAGQVGKSYIDKLQLDTQITTYIYGIQRMMGINIDGVIYRVLRKPSIKQTKKETLSQYLDRLTADYKERPEFYFFEEKLYRSQDDIAEFEAELWDLTQDMIKCMRENRWYKNTSRCLDWGNCEYMPLCLQRPDARDMYETRMVNSELEEGTDYASVASF
jgi:hypothetical protein